jgi:hypothetical protein
VRSSQLTFGAGGGDMVDIGATIELVGVRIAQLVVQKARLRLSPTLCCAAEKKKKKKQEKQEISSESQFN